jgi:hypothetical protein
LFSPNNQANSIQDVRSDLFLGLTKTYENLPPTHDALILHIRQAHYQTLMWSRALKNELHLRALEDSETGGKRCWSASARTDDLHTNRCNVFGT